MQGKSKLGKMAWSGSLTSRPLTLAAHTSKIMLKILQARLQQYVNCEYPDVQSGFRKGRGTRDQIANIRCIIKKAREFQKSSTFALLTMPKPLSVWITKKLENSERDGNTRPTDLPPEKSVCRSRSRLGGLFFPSPSEFSTVYCDPHSQKLCPAWHFA